MIGFDHRRIDGNGKLSWAVPTGVAHKQNRKRYITKYCPCIRDYNTIDVPVR